MEKKTVRIKIMHPEAMCVCEPEKVSEPDPIPADIVDRLSEAEQLIHEAFKLARAYTTINFITGDEDAENVVVKVYGIVGRIRDNAFKATR